MKKKIKDTGLGKWLKSKAPNVLDVVGDLLPDSGGLGIVKNLIEKDPEVDTAEEQQQLTQRYSFKTIQLKGGRQIWVAT